MSKNQLKIDYYHQIKVFLNYYESSFCKRDNYQSGKFLFLRISKHYHPSFLLKWKALCVSQHCPPKHCVHSAGYKNCQYNSQ